MLQGKVAVIYGAGGAIGGAVARAFAAEGARLFVTGHHRAPVELVAKDIESAGGAAEVAQIDAMGQFSRPIIAYTTSYFLTARLAARRMIPNKSGVIMTVSALHARAGIQSAGGYGPAMDAKEALTRQLSAEVAPHGVRVVGLRPQGIPDTRTMAEYFESRAAASGMTRAEWLQLGAGRTHSRRLMTLGEMASLAPLMASDQASGMTGTTVNLTMGSLDD